MAHATMVPKMIHPPSIVSGLAVSAQESPTKPPTGDPLFLMGDRR